MQNLYTRMRPMTIVICGMALALLATYLTTGNHSPRNDRDEATWSEFRFSDLGKPLPDNRVALIYLFGPNDITHGIMWPVLQQQKEIGRLLTERNVVAMKTSVETESGLQLQQRLQRLFKIEPFIPMLIVLINEPETGITPTVIIEGLIEPNVLVDVLTTAIGEARNQGNSVKVGWWDKSRGLIWQQPGSQ